MGTMQLKVSDRLLEWLMRRLPILFIDARRSMPDMSCERMGGIAGLDGRCALLGVILGLYLLDDTLTRSRAQKDR